MSGFNPSDERWRTITDPIYARMTQDGTGAGTPVVGMVAGSIYSAPLAGRLAGTIGLVGDNAATWFINNMALGSVVTAGSIAGPSANALIWAGDVNHSNATNYVAGSNAFDPYAATILEDPVNSAAIGSLALGSWGRVRVADCVLQFVDAGGGLIATATSADTKAGFGFGMPSSANVIPANPTYTLVIMYCDVSTLTWKLLTSRGSPASANQTATLVGVDAPAVNKNYFCRLVHDPIKGKASAWVNGVEGAVLSDPSKMPAYGGQIGALGSCQYNTFVQTGSNATSIGVLFGHPTEHIIFPWKG